MVDAESEEESCHEDYLKKNNLVPPKSYTSKIWKFFGFKASESEKKFGFCVLCDAKLKYCRNTTNLLMHFKGQHPLIYAKSELLQQKSAAKESCCSMHYATHSTDKEDDSQQTLNETFQTTAVLPANSRQAMYITNSIGYFMAKDMLPISTTNGIGFKRLLRVLEPRYTVPHRKTFTEKTLPAMYTNLKDNCVRPLVSSANRFALTTDCWTSRADPVFIGVTVYFITEDFQLKSFALTNEELPVSHNAANLASALEGVLEEWGLSHKNLSCGQPTKLQILKMPYVISWSGHIWVALATY